MLSGSGIILKRIRFSSFYDLVFGRCMEVKLKLGFMSTVTIVTLFHFLH